MSLKKASRKKSLSLSDDFPGRLSPVGIAPHQPPRHVAAAPVAAAGPNAAAAASSPNSGLTASRFGGLRSRRVEDTAKIFKYIDDNVIGKGVAFLGPFGRRKVVYADYSSSGRSLQFLEDYINKEVLPAYGDINCTSSVTGLQSQLYYKEAKDLIRSAVNASADDEIVFCEAAYTSPVERIAHILCLRDCASAGTTNGGGGAVLPPVLFCSTSEPEHNVRPWLDLGVQIERIAKTHDGYLDLDDLERRLAAFVASRRRLIGLFSGASRLTGILADDVATTILLHQYGALSVWDYSPAAPCTIVDTNPQLPGATKDAVFFCASKFVGGVQAPGVLILKKTLLANSQQNIYDSVGVVGAVRAGLVIQLKESLGTQAIMNRHEKLCKQMLAHIRTIPEILLLGSLCETVKRLPTVCFMVRHSRGTYLHHRFVVAVLNDVFGIQATAHTTIVEAMSIAPHLAVQYERLLLNGSSSSSSGRSSSAGGAPSRGSDDDEVTSLTSTQTSGGRHASLAPGYTQITLPFFMADAEVGFVLEAVKMVATEAWKLLPQYVCDEQTAEWRHQSNALRKERKWLGAIRYTDGRMLFNDRRISGPGVFPQNYGDCLQTARNLFNRSRKMAQKTAVAASAAEAAAGGGGASGAGGAGSGGGGGLRAALRMGNTQAEVLRWYMLPGEAHELLLGHSQNVKHVVPFDPNKALETSSMLHVQRHYSMPTLDTRRFKSHSLPTSPIHYRPIIRQQSSPSPTRNAPRHQSPIPERRETPVTPPTTPTPMMTMTQPSDVQTPVFSLGGEVTPGLRSPSSGSSDGDEVDAADAPTKRNRCHTWSSSSMVNCTTATNTNDGTMIAPNQNGAPSGGGLKSLSPQTRISLGLESPCRGTTTVSVTARLPRRRLCSCSSQTDAEDSPDVNGGLNGFGNGCEGLSGSTALKTLRSFSMSNASINNSDSEDIETYVKSITEGIADNLKSEIREVISRVEDVLDHAESTAEANLSSLQMLHMQHINSADDLRHNVHSPSDSVSASDVAEYLKEFSKGITSQVTSEIREVANAMNSTDAHDATADLRRYSPPDIFEQSAAVVGVPMLPVVVAAAAPAKDCSLPQRLQQHRYSDTIVRTKSITSSASQTISSAEKQRSDSFPATSSSLLLMPPHCPASAPSKCRAASASLTTAPCPELSTPNCPYTGAVSKFGSNTSSSCSSGGESASAASMSTTMSQDSGINMSFCEQTTTKKNDDSVADNRHNEEPTTTPDTPDNLLHPELFPRTTEMFRSLSSRTTISELSIDELSNSSASSSAASSRQHSHVVLPATEVADATDDDAVVGSRRFDNGDDGVCRMATAAAGATAAGANMMDSPNQWQYLPQAVWKQTAETIDEFGMLHDGDRILVGLSGSSASLAVLHALRQFVRARQLQHVVLAAVQLGTTGGVDPRALMLYMRDLRVRLFCEPLAPGETIRAKLQTVARQHGFNVLALGSTVDKLADDFLHSVLRRGRLAAMQAHCRNGTGDLRIVRPFLVGVRERCLEDMAVQHAWPARPSRRFSRPPDAANSILRVQESLNPAVYENIKAALRPLLALRIQEELDAPMAGEVRMHSRAR